MLHTRHLKWLALAITLILLAVFVIHFVSLEMNTCLGVPLISESELTKRFQKIGYDFSESITFNGEPCAADNLNYRIYISQDLENVTKHVDLQGKLETNLAGHMLYFVENDTLSDIKTGVAEGKPLRLIVVNPAGMYTEYSVYISTLAVIRLDGVYDHKDEEGREVNLGDICIWDPSDPAVERYSVKTSELEWRVRGNTSTLLAKKPYKLSLKNKDGENKDLDLLGLGADDDWILNPMNTDDTFVRERLAMDLWNDSFATEDHNATMSRGEYVEIIINGTYSGIYMIQRRIDKKLLELGPDDFLLKGTYALVADYPSVSYEIDYSSMGKEETFEFLHSLGLPNGENIMDLDNFIDVSLLIQLGTMNDNKGYKNTFYLVEKTKDGYSLRLTLWDTDLSFASSYSDWFEYDYDGKLNGTFNRREYEDMVAAYPELDRMMAERWFELRKSIFTSENLNSYIDSNYAALMESGAIARDYVAWGVRHGHLDTVEKLKTFIAERLAILDAYYTERLK